jgi:CRP/FNR family cyclic AMP-dependent transcriptional regulator
MMWGIASQRTLVRERLKLLLAGHDSEIKPVELTAEPGALLLRQGMPAEQVFLLIAGAVAIQVRQGEGEPHTMAIVEAEDLLGEVGLFGNGVHSADVRVLDAPAQLIAVDGNDLLKALLFDTDLSVELLSLISQRCLQSNDVMGLLLDGIQAAHSGDQPALERTCEALRLRDHSLARAADRLRELAR